MANSGFKITDEEAVERVKRLVDVEGASTFRRPFERTALKNRLYYLGKHWFIEDPRTGFLRDYRPLASGKILYKANLILGNILRSVLTVTGANGEFSVPPKKNTRVAEKAAWVSTKLFEHISQMCRMREKDQLACIIAALDGAVVWKVHWDPETGETSRFYKPPRAGGKYAVDVSDLERQQLEEAGRYEDFPQGDVKADLLSLFQFWWDWKAREGGIDDAEWVAQGTLVQRDKLREQYGRVVDDVQASDGRDTATYWNELVSFMAGTFGTAGAWATTSEKKDDDRIFQIELWERPRPSNGNMGRYIVTAENVLLEQRDNKYRVTKYPLPFVRQNWITCPGRFWGISLAENLTSPQHQYNAARSKVIQHQNAFGTPTTYLPKGWGVPKTHVTTEPGAVIEYDQNAGGQIQYGPTPELPAEVAQNAAAAQGEIGEISGQQSIDNSKLPGQIRGAPGLDVIMKERNKQLIHPAENFLLGKEAVGRQMLSLAQKFYDENRIVHYVGEDDKWRVLHFKKADIDADLRVSLDPNKILDGADLVRMRVQEMVGNGTLNPAMNQDDRADVLRAMNFDSSDGLLSARVQEEENQEREIEEMIADPMGWIAPRPDTQSPMQADPQTGHPVPRMVQGYPTNSFDDDQAHVRPLQRFMRSQEYRDLALQGQTGITAQSLLQLHLQEHQGKIQQQMMQQLQMQQLMQAGQGAPGAPGQPSRAKQPTPQV